MPRRNHRKERRSWGARAAFGLGALLAASGCATTGPGPAPGADHVFTITFETDPATGRHCPKAASVAEVNCPDKRRDCVVARRGQRLAFVAEPATPFELYFDPFRKAPLRAASGNVSLQIDPKAPYKTYAFNVMSGYCEPLDPIIIVTQ